MIRAIMTALILALLLATASGSSHVGRLYVHVVTPGLQILGDGVSAGTSTAEEGGKLIRNVAAGTHRVVVRAEDGRDASFIANISNDLQTDITVSPLGFRKLNRAPDTDESSTLRLRRSPSMRWCGSRCRPTRWSRRFCAASTTGQALRAFRTEAIPSGTPAAAGLSTSFSSSRSR